MRHRLIPWLLLVLFGSVNAQTNMAYVFPVGTPKDVPVPNNLMGEWQPVTPDSIVLTGDAGQSYAQGVLRRFGDIGTKHVYACTVNVPAGQRDGCPTPGVYTGERFIPHWQAYRTPSPPVCYGNTLKCHGLAFATATGPGELAMCMGQYENIGTSTAPKWQHRCACANKLDATLEKWAAWKESLTATKARRDALYRQYFVRGLTALEHATCLTIFKDNPPPK